MPAQVVIPAVTKYIFATVGSFLFGDRGPGTGFQPLIRRGAEMVADQIRSQRPPAPPAVPGGPSVADRMPPPSSLPYWAIAPVIAFPTKKQRKKRGRVKRVAKARTQAEMLLKQAQELAKKNPRLAKVLTRYGKYGRAGSWAFGPLLAWDVGQWVGGQIYQRSTDWYYRPRASVPAAPGAPPRRVMSDREIIRRAPQMPAGQWDDMVAPETPDRPANPGFGRPRAPVPGPAKPPQVSQPSPGTMPRPQTLPRTVKIPKIDPRTIARPGQIPVSRAAGLYARWQGLPEWARRGAIAGATALLFEQGTKAKSPYTRSPAAPAPYTPPTTVGLTSLQSNPLPFARTATDKCKPCPKPKKRQRKDGKPPCRNPVTSRRSKTRDGARYITVTRRIECPA